MITEKIQLHQVKKVLRQVNRWAPRMRQMSDQQLKAETTVLRRKIKEGQSLAHILPEAYATVREVDYRLLGEFPYDVQVMGAIVLNQGSIAEMKTGEGKTLTATMPLYLNALSGKGAMLVTTNNYLSQRDKESLAPVYQWLGLTISNGFLPEGSKEKATPQLKRKWYAADIVYTTASTLAFDYLFNNLAGSKDKQFMRPFNYVVIDEVDAVLLDEAQSPFVVATSPSLQSNLYQIADSFVKVLVPKKDYTIRKNDQLCWLTYKGVKKAERFFKIGDLFSERYRELYRHIVLALRAHLFMRRDHDYVVLGGKVILLDEQDGRLKEGVQLSTGIQQAIETKEGVKVTTINKTAASITYPSLFGLFKKVSGMSGTAKVNEGEFLDTYNMRVVTIPTRKPVIRKDYAPRIFLTTADKLLAAISDALRIHRSGRPILLVTGSVENSEIVSELLLNYGIAHNVLNAFNAAKEAAIVKDAGQEGAVTVATNMAGRGTDIKLGPGIKEKGGLAVIGTEMLPPRIKLQLAGRSGRQGDPGSSQFFVSLEDKYIAQASTTRQRKHYRRLLKQKKKGRNIVELHSPLIRASLKMLQDRVESNGVLTRAMTNKYANAMNLQREHFYEQRKKIVAQKDLQGKVDQLIDTVIADDVIQEKNWNQLKLKKLINKDFSYDYHHLPPDLHSQGAVNKYLHHVAHTVLAEKKKILINEKQKNMFYRQVILNSLDACWLDEVGFINDLRVYASNWGFSGRVPDYLYQKTAYDQFVKMLHQEKISIVRNLLLSTIYINDKGQLIVVFN